MANRNKQRGYELEKETADFWKENGVEARRVFASGAYARLGEEFDMIVVREDRARRLYVMEEDTVLDLLRLAGLVSETKIG